MAASTWFNGRGTLYMTDKKTNRHISIHSRHFVAQGDPVMKQGEPGTEAYLIQSGKVRVYAEHDGKVKDLAILGPGQIFGEMALIVDGPRSASVEALENCNLIIITRPMIIEKLAKTDPTIRALVPMLMHRIKDANKAALNHKDSFEDLVAAAQAVYKGVYDELDAKKRVSLERAVQPKLDAYVKAIQDFEALYK